MREQLVDSVMTRNVISVRPDLPVKGVAEILVSKKISAVPVVDDAGRPVGVVSEADVALKQEFHGDPGPLPWWASRRRRARHRKLAGLTAAELMTAPVVTVGEHESVTVAARRIAAKRLRRLFVVDDKGTLVGVLSRRDVLSTFLRADEEIKAEIEREVLGRGMWLEQGAVTVDVADGVATLDGRLDHRSARDVAGWLTLAVPGVVGVRNDIQFEIDDTVSTAL